MKYILTFLLLFIAGLCAQAQTPPVLTGVVSRMAHGSAGAFDISLATTGSPSIESRRTDGNFNIVFTFDKPVTRALASLTGAGSMSGSPTVSGNSVTVSLTGMANAQTVRVTLPEVVGTHSNATTNLDVTFKLLQADLNASATVNSTDVAIVKSKLGLVVDATNAPFDVNASGAINSTDVAITKAFLGTSADSGTASLPGDMDGDGLSDSDELALGTAPDMPDSDDDGIPDGDEVHIYHTKPDAADSDADGLSDEWEIVYDLDPNDSSDAEGDPDEDGLATNVEIEVGTDPHNPDSDGDNAQ